MSIDVEAAKAMLRFNEGVRTHLYYDDRAIPTIGVGFNLNRAGANSDLARFGCPTRAELLLGHGLTCEQIEALLDFDVGESIADLRALFPGFIELPAPLQRVLIDMRFNLGPARLREFEPTLKLIRDGQCLVAAKRIARTPYFKQVGKRAERNCEALRRLGNTPRNA